MTTWQHFWEMGGYAVYIWPAYGSVFTLLSLQLILPWRRWQRYLRKQQNNNNS